MAKNKKNTYTPKEEKKEKVRTYKSPTQTVWGKIIIAVLAIGMLCSGLITLIYLIATKS